MRAAPATRAGLGLLIAMTVGACVRLPDAPTLPTDDNRFTQVDGFEPGGVDQDPPRPLVVMPGDMLAFSAFSTETTSYEGLVVDELGRVHLPLVGTVEVGGISLADAEARIQEAMRRVDRVVQIGLRIADPRGQFATVLGAVRIPGRYAVVPGMRIADLLAVAGGTGEPSEPAGSAAGTLVADLDGARLVRDGSPVPISLRTAMQGDPRHNVRVRPGDYLHIPSARGHTITVLGAVSGATVLAHRDGIRLTEVIARAGGLEDRGDRTDVHIVRGELQNPLVYRASLRAIVNGNSNDVVLAAGDVVYVTEEWTSHVGEVLERVATLLTDPATIALTAALLAQ
ncbi:MAG: SLBB domain-containing protein [Sandaracinus sp.]|nr:SLBB domain-containing protein [Sandaracinus sp.]